MRYSHWLYGIKILLRISMEKGLYLRNKSGIVKTEEEKMLQKCEQQKNVKEKLVFQNLQKTTCKKWLWKPLFMRLGRG